MLDDLMSQKVLLQEMNSELQKRVHSLETSAAYLIHEISKEKKAAEELRDDKKMLSGLLVEPKKNKILRNVTIVIALGLAAFIFISYIPSDLENYYNSIHTPLKTQYLVQNLQGNTVDTWKPWHLVNDEVLNINIVNADKVSKEKIDAIKDAILSEESVKIDNSLLEKGPVGTTSVYYKGWQGAIQGITDHNTKFHLPTRFNIVQSPTGEGEITITLSSLENPDGYSGYTKNVVDGDETIRSSITIYNVDHIDPERLAAIVRHEFGHALGLGHATDQEDLMHYVIETNFPFVSSCDINTIKNLYDDSKPRDITCGT